jgi:hypothetical protein
LVLLGRFEKNGTGQQVAQLHDRYMMMMMMMMKKPVHAMIA